MDGKTQMLVKKWSLIVVVNKAYCSHGSNESRPAATQGFLLMLSCSCSFLQYTAQCSFLELGLQVQASCKPRWSRGNDGSMRKTFWLCILIMLCTSQSSLFVSDLCCHANSLILVHTRTMQLTKMQGQNGIPPKDKFEGDGWRQIWHFLFCVSVFLRDSVNRVVYGTNVDLILSSSWHEGKFLWNCLVWISKNMIINEWLYQCCAFISLHHSLSIAMCSTSHLSRDFHGSIPLFGC